MRAAFLGTPAAAVPSLAALVDVADVDVVVTRPDAPRKRSQTPVPPPVKVAALEWGLEVAQPATGSDLLDVLEPRSLDFAVVVAYGRILRPEVLATTRFGFLNVHFSLLPRWRGAAPVEWAIASGDPVTGVSLMVLDEGLDTGPVVAVLETPIAEDETGGSLTARLSYLGAALLDEALPGYLRGDLQPAPQLEAGARPAPRLRSDEGRIDPKLSARRQLDRIRAFTPRPGVFCEIEGRRLGVLAATPAGSVVGPVGSIEIILGVPILFTSDGAIELVTVQPAGKRPMSGSDWANGRRGRGAVLDPVPA